MRFQSRLVLGMKLLAWAFNFNLVWGRSMRELTLSWLVSELKLLCGLLFTNLATWCCTFSSFRMSLLRYGSVTEDAYSSPDRTVVRQAFSKSFLRSIQKSHDRKAIIALWGWFSRDVLPVTCCEHGPPSIATVHFSKFSIATNILFN